MIFNYILLSIILFTLESKANDKKIIFCYFKIQVNTDDAEQVPLIEAIPLNYCTHLGYLDFVVHSNGAVKYKKKPTIHNLMINVPGLNQNQDRRFEQLKNLRYRNTKLKIILAIIISKSEVKKFSNIIKSYEKIQYFIKTAIEIMEENQFDGLDIDWNYPLNRQFAHKEMDKNNFLIFLQLIKIVFVTKNYILSVAIVAPQPSIVNSIYDLPEIHKYLDFINLKTYNFYGTWNGKTGFHAPLEGTRNPKLNVIAAIEYWLNNDVPANKLVMGVSFYGRTFLLKDKTKNGVGAAITLQSNVPTFSTENKKIVPAILPYSEICKKVKHEEFREEFNMEMKSTYSYHDNDWISYENERSINHKLNFMKSKNLAGIMIWTIDADDYKNNCGSVLPLTSFIYDTLNNTNYYTKVDIHMDEIESIGRYTIIKEGDNFTCTSTGLFPKKYDCNKFNFCAETNDIIPIVMTCPAGLLFDKKLSKCNTAALVTCSKIRRKRPRINKLSLWAQGQHKSAEKMPLGPKNSSLETMKVVKDQLQIYDLLQLKKNDYLK